MDAVELALPEAAAIAVSKLMGSSAGRFGRGADVGAAAAGKVEAGQSETNPLLFRSSVVDKCGQRAKMPPTHASEPTFLYKIPDTERFVPNGQPSSCHGGDTSEDLKRGEYNSSQSLVPDPEAKNVHQRTGKVARSSSGLLKRLRIVQLECSIKESSVDDLKGNSAGPGSFPAKIVSEKAQVPKQRANSNGKQADKRNGRAPKSRSESFCLKNGFVSFSSVAGGSNFLAAYGSKSHIFDVTNPADELPLSELLDGSYKRPSLVKEKGKAVQDSNENFLNSVRKACSLLRIESPIPASNYVDVDNNYNPKVLMGPFSTGSSSASRMDGDTADSCTVNQHPNNKDSFDIVKEPALAIDSQLLPPKDILERLALPPSKELDSLLLDAVKPASSSRNTNDPRVGKTASHRNGLPPFTWSHNSSGHSKSGPDAVKLSANRSMCPGRWVKVGNTLTPSKGSNGLTVDLKSITYNHRLVPHANLECAPVQVENVSSKSVNIYPSEQIVLSSATCSASRVPAAEHSPRLFAAAKTLCEIASSSSKQNSQEMTKWLKKPAQKMNKDCKVKQSQRSDTNGVAPKAPVGPPDYLDKFSDGMFTPKKMRLTVDDKHVAVCHTNLARREPIWFATRSIRSSPSKLFGEPVPLMRNYNNTVAKNTFMMPPPNMVNGRSSNSRQKLKNAGSEE